MGFSDFEKLDVYTAAIDLTVLADEIVGRLPRDRAYLAEQLQRESNSLLLDVAEGAGECEEQEKVRFYRMAKRSATECVGILDICHRLRLIEEEKILEARQLLTRIVSMLTKMVRNASLPKRTQKF